MQRVLRVLTNLNFIFIFIGVKKEPLFSGFFILRRFMIKNRIFLSIWVLFYLITFSGCSSNRESQGYLDTYKTAIEMVWSDKEFSQEEASDLDYASILLSVDGENPVLMPLGYLKGQKGEAGRVQQWFSKDLVSLSTKNGRIIQTYNTSEEISNIKRVDFYTDVTLKTIQPRQSFDLTAEIDYLTQKRFGVKAQLTVSAKQLEERILWGQPFSLLRIEEKVVIPALDYEYTNLYWKDPKTDFIWESVQKWSPNAYEFHYQVVKPWITVNLP